MGLQDLALKATLVRTGIALLGVIMSLGTVWLATRKRRAKHRLIATMDGFERETGGVLHLNATPGSSTWKALEELIAERRVERVRTGGYRLTRN